MALSPTDLREYLDFAVDLAVEAGRTTLKYFRSRLTVDRKSDRSPVTVADRETEQLIRGEISRRYPEHGVLGEEHGETNPGVDLTWIVDPIDGTKSFIRGIPLYTVLVALVDGDSPVLGVVHCPPLAETVSAAVGLGCRYNGDPCRVSDAEDLSESLVLTTDFADLDRRLPEFAERLYTATGMARTWADGYGYLMVATGRAEAMIDPVMNVWDIAPLGPIITEAGGVFTDVYGATDPTGASALAAAPSIHRSIVALHLTLPGERG